MCFAPFEYLSFLKNNIIVELSQSNLNELEIVSTTLSS